MFGIESKNDPIKGPFAEAIIKTIADKEKKGVKPRKKNKKKNIFNYDGIVLR